MKMKHTLFALALAVGLFAASAFAQNTVTGTVRDPNGNPYANGTVSAYTGVGNGTTPLALSASGFFSLSLATNTYVFTICGVPVNLGPRGNPAPNLTCFTTAPIAIAASTDISAIVNPTAAVVGPPASNVIVQYTATAALTAGQAVISDSSNAGAVLVAATSSTGGGLVLGVVLNSPAAGGTALVLQAGSTPLPLLDSGTCTLGQFVIVGTTTAGRVKCTGTYTAGTEIGVVTLAQSTVGSNLSMVVQLR
jgi:hypothetical protein